MTTLRTRTHVSVTARAAALLACITLGACASAPSRLARDGASLLARPSISSHGDEALADAPAPTIHFDNQGHDQVRVYLVDEKQQWLLGRVERGASSTLKMPKAVLDGTTRWVRLAVVADDRTAAGSASARSTVTMGIEPLERILIQRWTFSQSLAGGELSSLPVTGH